MAPRRLVPLGAAIVALVLAAHAAAATKVATLADAAPTALTGVGGSNGFVWLDWCQIMRVAPATGLDGGTPSVYVGTPCGTEGAREVWTSPVNVNIQAVGFGAGGPIARAADGSLYVSDQPLGLVDKVTTGGTPTVVTIAGIKNGCGVPADDSLAKDANICDIWGLAADPSTAGNFAIWTPGDQLSDGAHRVYLVSGTSRDDSTIKTVAGSCNGSAATAALQLCLPLFDVSIAYLDSSTLLIGTGTSVLEVTIASGAVATVNTTDSVVGVTRGFGGDDFFYATDTCQIHHVAAGGTDTVVAGNGSCDPTQRHDGVEATQSAFGDLAAIASFPGGLLVADKSFYGGVPSQIRLVDRTSLLSVPAGAINTGSVSIAFATLPGDGNNCYFGGAYGGEQFFVDCPSPFERDNLGDDNYVFEVNGSSAVSSDLTSASTRWITDRAAPNAPVLAAPAADAGVDSATPALTWQAAADNGLFGATSDIERYEVSVDGKLDQTVATANCCATTPTVPLSEGTHTWSVRVFDRAGNSATSETRSFSYGSPPHAGLTVSPNPALAGATVTLNASTSSDREGPIASYAFDLDGDGNFEQSGTSPTATTSFAAAGTFKVGVKVTDGVGQSDQTSADVKVNAQAIPGGLLGVTINNGAQYTRDANVELGVKFPSAITAILVSNDGGFLVPQSFAAQQTIKWRLDSSGPERLPKIVYVRFQNGLTVSDNFTDDIILDETPPVVKQATLAGAAGSRAALAAKARKFTVKVKATDSNSGVQGLQVTANKRKPGKVLTYKRKLSLKSAAKPKFVRARDRAGNFSKWKKLR